jgi:hypothetical protein
LGNNAELPLELPDAVSTGSRKHFRLVSKQYGIYVEKKAEEYGLLCNSIYQLKTIQQLLHSLDTKKESHFPRQKEKLEKGSL